MKTFRLLLLTIFFLIEAQNHYSVIYAQSQPDVSQIPQSFDDKNLLDEEESLDEEGITDDEGDFEDPFEEGEHSSNQESRSGDETSPIRLSISHQVSNRLLKPKRVVTNRSSIRLQFETVFSDHYSILFDGIGTVFHANDHQTKARDEDASYTLGHNLREFFVESSLESWSAKFGKQIVVWGESDSPITDEISPLDGSEMHTKFEDSRIGQTMLILEFYQTNAQWSLIINPDVQGNRLGHADSEYASTDDANLDVQEESDYRFGSKVEVGLRWKKFLEFGDIALMIAGLHDNNIVHRIDGKNNEGQYIAYEELPPFQMIGLGGKLAAGNFLWKPEIAYKKQRSFQRKNLEKDEGIIKKDTLEGAIGLDYKPSNSSSSYSIGLLTRHIVDWTDDIDDEDEFDERVKIGFSDNYLNQTLSFSYSLKYQVQDEEAMQTIRLTYKVTDHLNLDLSLDYFTENQYEEDTTDNDSRITCDVKYYF